MVYIYTVILYAFYFIHSSHFSIWARFSHARVLNFLKSHLEFLYRVHSKINENASDSNGTAEQLVTHRSKETAAGTCS